MYGAKMYIQMHTEIQERRAKMYNDMHTKIQDGYYKNKVEYPSKPVKPRLGKNATSVEAKVYAEALESWEKNMEDWRDKIKEYRKIDNQLYMLFKRDALDDTGLTNHPKAEKAWEMAWDRGHSSGYYEVYQQLCELSDLLI